MAFGIADFRDLVRLLDEHPEWRAELRRLVLTDELLSLPGLIQQLAARVDGLAARVDALAEAQQRTEARVDELGRNQIVMNDQLSDMRGDLLEARYRQHAGGYFGRLVQRVRVLRPEALDSLIDEAIADGAFDVDAAIELRLADLVLRGRRPNEEHVTFAVVQVSTVVDASDVEPAARRAGLLSRYRPTLAVVAGRRITEGARARAAGEGVWQVVDGTTIAP